MGVHVGVGGAAAPRVYYLPGSLFADRMSTHTIAGNQLRLWLSAAAYVLALALRRLGLRGSLVTPAPLC